VLRHPACYGASSHQYQEADPCFIWALRTQPAFWRGFGESVQN